MSLGPWIKVDLFDYFFENLFIVPPLIKVTITETDEPFGGTISLSHGVFRDYGLERVNLIILHYG